MLYMILSKQAEKLKSREIKRWRMMMKMVVKVMMKGFASWQTDRQTDGRTDIGDCRVAFATEKSLYLDVSSVPN